MALLRVACFGFKTVVPVRQSALINKTVCAIINPCVSSQERHFRKAYGRILKVMRRRRQIAGPERIRRRSEWDNWNYQAEIYAFNKRLQENISDETLRQAFVDEAFIESEIQKRKELDILSVDFDLKSNAPLVSEGNKVMSHFIKRYSRYCFPRVPEEGICAIHDYLMSDEVLSHVSFNLGTSELIFCPEYPPEKSTLASNLSAIIGAIAKDGSQKRAEVFVLDFVCPQLIGKDILDIWDIKDPLSVLDELLRKHHHEASEARLIFESGRNTLQAIYHVGLYSNETFLGRGPGETLGFAQEMAAYDALRRIFGLKESEQPLPLGEQARKLTFDCTNEHPIISEWYSEKFKMNLAM